MPFRKIKQMFGFGKPDPAPSVNRQPKPRDKYLPHDHYLGAIFIITYRCQCSCSHCVSGIYTKDKDKEFSTEGAKELIRKFADFGVDCVAFFGGEPLLRDDILELIRYTREIGMSALLDSNGWMIDEKMAGDLAEAGLGVINISIDSVDPEIHDKGRGIPGLFEQAINAIKLCKSNGITTLISSYADREKLNSGATQAVIDFGKKLGVRLRYFTPLRSGKWLDNEEVIFKPEDLKKFKSLLSPDGACWENDFCDSPEKDFHCLSTARGQFTVTAFGDITPCPAFELAFGNVKEEPLEDILKRMWSHYIFNRTDGKDCPLNDPAFRREYADKIRNATKYPIRIDEHVTREQ